MKIYGINRYGGKNNSDIIIHASGEGLNELGVFCDTVLEKYFNNKDYVETSTVDRCVKMAFQLKLMMNSLNDNPKRLFETYKGE